MPNRTKFFRHRASLCAVFLLLCPLFLTLTTAQSLPEARRETLLNGLRVVLWPRPNDGNILLRLRIHSGAAFDLAGKSGTMGLLSDVLFYDPATREAVEKDYGGKLLVTVNHDALDITITGEGDVLLPLVNVIRSAIININPLPENERILALRAARVKLLSAPPTPSSSADEAALKRFFGAFPYARNSAGVAADAATLDRNDLIFLRERFLNPNNATLIIAGNFNPNRAYLITRQLLGNWRKSDAVVPSTFRQPETPDERVLLVNQADASEAQVRLLLRGVARNDKDYLALTLLAAIAQTRWQTALGDLPAGFLNVRQDARTLPGFFLMSGKTPPEDAAKALSAARATLEALAADGPSADELQRARNALITQLNKRLADPESVAEIWLDADTYRLTPFADQLRGLNNLTPSDLKKTAFRLFRAVPAASVALGPLERMRPEIEKTARVEVLGEKPLPTPTPTTPNILGKPKPKP